MTGKWTSKYGIMTGKRGIYFRIVRSGGGEKKLAVRVKGNWGEPMDPLNPPSASNTNPVRNGYLRRSK